MSIAAPVRRRLLAAVDRCPPVADRTLRLAAGFARRRGADPSILGDAVGRRDQPLERSLQVIAWAAAMAGSGPMPKHFNPGDHLISADARAAAARLLSERRDRDSRTQRDLIHVADDADLDTVRRLVESHLQELIAESAVRPQRGTGIDPALQVRIIDELTRALARIAVRPFLMSGTLLGFVRDGGPLPHDYDIDLGLMPGVELAPVADFVSALEGYDVSVFGRRIVAVHESGVSVDLFTHESRDGCFWHSTLIHEWWNTPFELHRARLGDVDVWIPSDPERYLDENYGRWNVPVPFYDISFDTPNRTYRHGIETLRFLHSRCASALAERDRWRLESAARELRDEFDVDITELLAPTPMIHVDRSAEPVSDPGCR